MGQQRNGAKDQLAGPVVIKSHTAFQLIKGIELQVFELQRTNYIAPSNFGHQSNEKAI